MKIYSKILLISAIGMIVFGLNSFLNFIPFDNQKTNSFILLVLSFINFALLIKKANDDLLKTSEK